MAGASILLWKDLSFVASERLVQCTSEVSKTVRELLEMPANPVKRDLVILDKYSYLVQFAQREKMSPAQMSVLFSLLRTIHQSCLSTPYDNMTETFDVFKSLLLCHSVDRPPFSVHLFSVDQVKRITEYFLSTYFKHFRLYKYAFTKKQRLDIKFLYSDLPDSPPVEKDEEPLVEQNIDDTEEQTQTAQGTEDIDQNDTAENSGVPVSLNPREAEVKRLVEEQLSSKLQSLRTTVIQDLEDYDRRMSAKISSLETNVSKGKGKKK